MNLLRKLFHMLPRRIHDYIGNIYEFLYLRRKGHEERIAMSKITKRIEEMKNTANGKRCFIVGNGPSLSVEDLDKLVAEDCFGTNRIYQLFDKTVWRPKYYCSQDVVLLEYMNKQSVGTFFECEKVFLSGAVRDLYGDVQNNLYYFYLNNGPFRNYVPPFSKDVSREIFEGYTVTYACIQLAVYMGYKEIYLLGVDHNYVQNNNTVDGVRSYAKGLEIDATNFNLPHLDRSQKAYEVAKKFCDKHGIIIKNATRGGHLEVYERIDLDELLNNY